MITKENLPELLAFLGFQKHASTYRKTIGAATLEVNFSKGEITYPEGLIVNQKQTCNLLSSENFVVLECVHRLLEKGYKPEHIELEPAWKVGHGASGGRADILIKDNAKKPLLIIECKTAGSEFKKAWNKTLQDGDQLFSYAQQISETQFLSLYASDFDGGALTYISHVIAHRDNDKYLADNPRFTSFKSVTDVKERFAVWRDTYKLDYTTKGIFEGNIQPYHIGKDKYSLDDLQAISATDQQKKYHEFATILRQHNVSGRENAFDKLVNLFLCKLVDETENPHELKFYWKGVAYDTHFELLDRLQQLYQAGMGKFLGESITYIDQSAVHNAMRFIKQNPDATQKAVWQLFLQQKFFTNNDFSLIDVHNEKLFYQNADVLLKILQMWQDIRLTETSGHNQFLGDLFEGFLDQGVKQSEGQYFTPMPICRFILMSLPLETLVKRQVAPPKAIDYACGAGHFLTELARQLNPLIASDANLADYHQAIIGIEKEYRLSKVAKVSAFMYGQQEIKICYGDALVKKHAAFPEIHDNSFDLLVANPPYSVRGFLETLSEEERAAYSLTDTIGDLETANSIEAFFIERARQLLKAGGVAAIILPSSILSNGGNTYVKTREILLQYFDIVAIAEFGSGTFGETGTNTVTLFLRRKATAPDTAEHYRERVDEWFRGCENNKRKQVIYKDEHLIEHYAAHIGVQADDYKTLLRGQPAASLLEQETFSAYRKAFDASSEIVNLKKQKGFKAKAHEEQVDELGKRFLAFVQAIERDKLYYFVMASDQPNPVLILKSPTDSKAQKQFLGYGWSGAKGDQGIKLIKDAHGHHLTPLYDETDRRNAAKLNRCIADNFDGTLPAIPASLSEFVSMARLVDMLDFSRVAFEKQIALAVRKTTTIQSKWPLVKLADHVETIGGLWTGKKPPFRSVQVIRNTNFTKTGKLDLNDVARIEVEEKQFASRSLKKGDIVIEKSGGSETQAVGRVVIFNEISGSYSFSNFTARVRTVNDSLNPYYLHEWLNYYWQIGSTFALQTGSSGLKNLDLQRYLETKIPLPSIKCQQQIVSECESVDSEVTAAQASIANAQADIAARVDAIYVSTALHEAIDKLALAVQYGLSEKMNEANVGYKIFRMNEIVRGRMFDGGSMKCADISSEEFAKYKLNRGDVLFNRTNSIEHVGKTGLFDLEGNYCFASYLVRVVPDTAQILPLFLTQMMNSKAFQKEAKGKASKAINQANINATVMRNIKVPKPSLAEQQRFVVKIEALERAISEAQVVVAASSARKQEILQRYL
ncbi:N-6 DNA methylase [Propionivibrio sp.]|uniref:N-6 DNA methylase n=1 Tax=Propionivibrio sp. TaxID=2212460 RepID=UPI003BEFF140